MQKNLFVSIMCFLSVGMSSNESLNKPSNPKGNDSLSDALRDEKALYLPLFVNNLMVFN